MKYKLNLCIMYALSITSLCTAMENTEIFLKNNYITDLSYAELPIVFLLGSKKIKLKPNILPENTKTLSKGTQVKLNDTDYGLCIGTHGNFQLAYYDAGSDTYQGGISDLSHIIRDIKKDKHNHPYHNTAIITINHSWNPKHFITNTWDFNITWDKSKLTSAKKTRAVGAQLHANPELINIAPDTHTSFLLISEMLTLEKSANSTELI